MEKEMGSVPTLEKEMGSAQREMGSVPTFDTKAFIGKGD
jgi:hypothetical protein